MKYPSLFFVAVFGTVLFLSACQNNSSEDKNSPAETSVQPMSPTPPTNPASNPPPTAEPAQNAAGVWHYTCSNGCEGGAGSAVACEKCGTTLVHNSAYHNNPNAPTQPSIATQPAATPPAAEPAQNAAGVWHYTCSSGCAGGAGSPIACSKCGKTLAHNSAYHQ